jgi:AAA+ superfamily predicted ATPase
LDDQKKRLTRIVCLLVNPSGLNSWAQKYHPQSKVFITSILRRLPLVVLSGDVGSGKTELAETVGDAVARLEKISISLFPLSLSTRGQGRVGEMTQLLSAAFEYAISEANRLKSSSAKSRGGVILLVDEADALAQSRESAQMHHEDRAGVNAFVRGIDRISKGNLPLAVIMCTNRLQALDPALRRRAADILTFGRPDETLRRAVLSDPLTQLGLSKTDIETLVSVTGAQKEHKYGFTFSDLTQRLLPAIVLDAYPTSAVNSIRAMEIARRMVPTPPFQEGAT